MPSAATQKITTFLMFDGQAGEAMAFYVSLFDDSKVVAVTRYGPEDAGEAGTVKCALFTLAGQPFMCIDSSMRQDFSFTPSMSLYVECDSEQEIDRLYGSLVTRGSSLMPLASYGFSTRFGWVTDRFGVSWQLNLADDLR